MPRRYRKNGLSFTKQGFCAICFVVIIGIYAIISGVNGLYLFLSLGLAIIIVSALLAETTIKHFQLDSISDVIADANRKFNLKFTAKNKSRDATIFGVETAFLLEPFKPSVIAKPIAAYFQGSIIKLTPQEKQLIASDCPGLPRGVYRRFLAFQRTKYPFGILEKFKMGEVESNFVIVPALKQQFYDELTGSLRLHVSLLTDDREFYDHRAYTTRDPIKYVDWKKSAGKKMEHWIVKRYKSDSDKYQIMIVCPWKTIVQTSSEESYENILSRVRTACEVVKNEGKEVSIDFGQGKICWGYSDCLRVLASLPKFEEKTLNLELKLTRDLRATKLVKLVVQPDTFYWLNEQQSAE